MLVSLKVPDEVFEAYGAQNPQNPRLAMEQTLERFKGVNPGQKAILLVGEPLAALQTLLGGSYDGASDLVLAIRKALVVAVDGVEVALTESQRKAISDTIKYFPKMEPREFTAQKIKEGLQHVLGV